MPASTRTRSVLLPLSAIEAAAARGGQFLSDTSTDGGGCTCSPEPEPEWSGGPKAGYGGAPMTAVYCTCRWRFGGA